MRSSSNSVTMAMIAMDLICDMIMTPENYPEPGMANMVPARSALTANGCRLSHPAVKNASAV